MGLFIGTPEISYGHTLESGSGDWSRVRGTEFDALMRDTLQTDCDRSREMRGDQGMTGSCKSYAIDGGSVESQSGGLAA